MTRHRPAGVVVLSLGVALGAVLAAAGLRPDLIAIAATVSIAAEVFRAGGDR